MPRSKPSRPAEPLVERERAKAPICVRLSLDWPGRAADVRRILAPELNRVQTHRAVTSISIRKKTIELTISGHDYTAVRAAWNSKLKALALINELQGIHHG